MAHGRLDCSGGIEGAFCGIRMLRDGRSTWQGTRNGSFQLVSRCLEGTFDRRKEYTDCRCKSHCYQTLWAILKLEQFNSRHKYPFDVTISDGHTKIRATFGKSCTKEFARLKGRKFTDRTLGGVLAIEDYNLVTFPPRLVKCAI